MTRLTMRRAIAALFVAVSACRTALAPAAGGEKRLPDGSMAGVWTIVFRLDSVRAAGVADCGFGASGVLHGDSLIGSWDETSFAGPVMAGRFVMTRSSR